ncbi:MAG: hypothetical protein EON58_02560 [Alphaproteobacteria bacterium]|nr:MAG: hypothetical protein EON58_02560 [Alphaproteobacteria bacterium]
MRSTSSFGRPIRESSAKGRKYDTRGNRTKLIDPDNNVRAFSYDPNSRLVSFTDGERLIITIAYDANGNLTTVTGSGSTITLFWDGGDYLQERS